MNILIVQSRAFPHTDNSFRWVYEQLVEWLTRNGYPSKLFFAYLTLEDEGYSNGLHLPDNVPTFYSPRNIDAIYDYIGDNDINALFDFSHIIIGDTRRFFTEIKARHPEILMLTMIHSCPRHTTQLKRYTLRSMQWGEVHSLKGLMQYLTPSVYMYLLCKEEKRQLKSAYETFDEVVVLSPPYIAELQHTIGIPDADRISAVPNAIRPVTSKIPVAGKGKRIIFVGRLEAEKRLPVLLEIWKKIQDELPDWKLTIVGNGSKYAECERIIGEEHLQRVEMTGSKMSIPYIDDSRILCLTSVIEGLPSVFIEAMALGVVPVGFESFAAIHGLIEDGKDGFIIPEGDTDAYASTLLKLAADDELRCRIASAAQQKKKYTIDNIGPLWLDVFKKHGMI